MKKLYVVLMAICITALVSCFSPWEGGNGTIALTLSDSSGISRAAVAPLNAGADFFEIRLTGPGGIERREIVPGGTARAQIAVTPGDWTVSVRRFGEGALQEIGFSDTVTVRAGQTVGAPVGMNNAIEINSAADITDNSSFNGYFLFTGDININSPISFLSRDITFIADIPVELTVNSMIPVDNGTLTLGRPGMSGAITINRQGGQALIPVLNIVNSTLVMHDRVTLTGNIGFQGGGGGVSVGGNSGNIGTFVMYGGRIYGNEANSGGGVQVTDTGVFIMHGGHIYGNSVANSGGGVSVSGTFTMYGGRIYGNSAANSGGGVLVNPGATFNPRGGVISGNSPDQVFPAD